MITEAAKQEFLISAISGASKPQIERHMEEYFDCDENEIKELMEIHDFKKKPRFINYKKFYDLNKDPIISPYTGEILNEIGVEDLEKEKTEEITLENDINDIEVNSEKENIEEIDETLETDDQIIPEIDEDTIPDLENSSDDEIIDSEPEADINEFDADDLDDLDNEDDDFIDEDDDVSDVIKNVQNDNAQE